MMSKITKRLSSIVVIMILAINVFDGILFQMQAFTLGDYIVRPTVLKFFLIVFLIPLMNLSKQKIKTIFFILILISLFIVNLIAEGNYVFEGFNLYYGSLLILCMMTFVPLKSIDLNFVKKSILIIMILSFIIAFLQWNDLIQLKSGITGEGEFVQSSRIYGIDRVFSIFSSGLNLGYTAIFGMLIALTLKGRVMRFGMMGLSIMCIYISFTRAVYIAATLVILLVFLRIIINKFPYILKKLSAAFLAPMSGLGVIYLASSLPATQNLLSSESSTLRTNSWSNLIYDMYNSDYKSILLGTGIYQGYSKSIYIIDNMYLAVLYNLGFLGLFIWLAIVFLYFSALSKIVEKSNMYLFGCAIFIWGFALVYNLSVGHIESLIYLYTLFLVKSGEKNV